MVGGSLLLETGERSPGQVFDSREAAGPLEDRLVTGRDLNVRAVDSAVDHLTRV